MPKKTGLANLKSDVDKLDINKLKNLPTNVSSWKSKIDKLDVEKKMQLKRKLLIIIMINILQLQNLIS